MPDDVSLEGPPRRMTSWSVLRPPPETAGAAAGSLAARHDAAGAAETTARNAWEFVWGWRILFLLAFAVAVMLVASASDVTSGMKAIAISLLSVCAGAYLLLGRRAITSPRERTGSATAYVAVVMVTFTQVTAVVPEAAFALFALCPQVFMMLRARRAVVAVLALHLAPGVRFLAVPGLGADAVVGFLVTSSAGLTFSIVFGLWTSRIIDQSAERAALIGELEASREKIERLSRERGAMAERERLAGEIHDTLAQGFTSIIMLIQAAEAQADPARHLGLAVRTARENLAETRGLIAALSPASLDGSTLEEALGRIAARLEEELGVPVPFGVDGASRPLPPATEVVLIRAAQEGLANVRKHAAASAAGVSLEYGEREVVLRVHDDGAGFDHLAGRGDGLAAGPGGGGPGPAGYGLRAMRNRVEMAGGTVEVDSAPGRGTRLTVRLPHEERHLS
ncbi:sensor histidine kinase [Sphaerisporangium sp. TRM90804]|uniref:sensor histidine kinase n=1 Tax=Sphaerisporangium sp. TRM90804 TaxID=3031113 RepID=UPI002448F85B|nr:sensor histidine kinase [Sphaerisporangium sp. TRM90804]MDH2429983.1 sensor histidine kinase [Sphaerisporangium sp. TRM90804]